ncbi:hypothetical protein NUW54_g11149 [Trametes sanguinea]|uniref:Uncharacterized protein n=1 Tax=Trametes sanguinea TaxID=158606 RepID=A0ACC1NKM0_9APHY|nr:hypothetical protein NUW54_g11149 [Trametes sanguinea]
MAAPGTHWRAAASAPTPTATPSIGRRRSAETATVHTARGFMVVENGKDSEQRPVSEARAAKPPVSYGRLRMHSRRATPKGIEHRSLGARCSFWGTPSTVVVAVVLPPLLVLSAVLVVIHTTLHSAVVGY